jgi:hypothetical protein
MQMQDAADRSVRLACLRSRGAAEVGVHVVSSANLAVRIPRAAAPEAEAIRVWVMDAMSAGRGSTWREDRRGR